MTTLHVLVPRPGSSAGLMIDPGSGIVAADLSTARVAVYFEGNRYDIPNLRTFAERVHCAAGRLDRTYPTMARGSFAREDFTVVGEYTYAPDWRNPLLTITDAALLAAWTGETR